MSRSPRVEQAAATVLPDRWVEEGCVPDSPYPVTEGARPIARGAASGRAPVKVTVVHGHDPAGQQKWVPSVA